MSEEYVVCRSYTRARRHPKVVGVIGGWRSPWPLTPTQIGALVATGVFLLKTRPVWSFVLPFSFLQLAVMAGGPVAAAWAVRHLRIEGRTPLQALSGAANYASRPRAGWVRGRPERPCRQTSSGARIFTSQ